MLTKEEINTFITLEYKVQDTANHVASIVKEWDPDLGKDENNTWWEIEFNDEKDPSKGYYVHGYEANFPGELLCMTDEELHAYVEHQKEQVRLWREARERMARIEEEMRQQEKQNRYQRLLRMSKKELLAELGLPEQMITLAEENNWFQLKPEEKLNG